MSKHQLFIGALDLSPWIVEKKNNHIWLVEMPTDTLKSLMLLFPQNSRVFGRHPHVCMRDASKPFHIVGKVQNYGDFEGRALAVGFWFSLADGVGGFSIHLHIMNAHQWKTFNLFQTEPIESFTDVKGQSHAE